MIRTALMVSDQHFIKHGGIGQFIKGYCDQFGKDQLIDVILDKAPSDKEFVEYMTQHKFSDSIRMIWPKSVVSYANHQKMFVYEDGLNIEKVMNFRNVLMEAHQHVIYERIVCNTTEALVAATDLNLQFMTSVIYYTHSENLIFSDAGRNKVFSQSFHDLQIDLMKTPGIVVGTQTLLNRERIVERFPELDVTAVVLGMFLPEMKLLNSPDTPTEKRGVLFIGRFEPRKRPATFLEDVMNAGLPIKILTNARGAAKFTKYLEERGYTDYEIKHDIIGKEKIDFIRSAKLAYHPSSLESYGFCALETLCCCPTVLSSNSEWHKNFLDIALVHDNEGMSDFLRSEYDKDDTDYKTRVARIASQQSIHRRQWNDLHWEETDRFYGDSDEYKPYSSQFRKTVKAEGAVWLSRFFAETLKRMASMEDIRSIYRGCGDMQVRYADDGMAFGFDSEVLDKLFDEMTNREDRGVFDVWKTSP